MKSAAKVIRPKRESVTDTVLDDDDAIDYFGESNDDDEPVSQIKPKSKPLEPAAEPVKTTETQAKAQEPEPAEKNVKESPFKA